jgi:hypothetical protein
MIKKHGKVVITQDAILITEFEFIGGDGRTAQADALEWALARLKAAQHDHLASFPMAVTNPIGERVWIKRNLRGITSCCSEDDPCSEHAGLAAEGMTCGFRSGPRGAEEGTQCRP